MRDVTYYAIYIRSRADLRPCGRIQSMEEIQLLEKLASNAVSYVAATILKL